MSTFKNKNSLRTIEAQIVQKLKNNEARPKFTGSYKKKSVYSPYLHRHKTKTDVRLHSLSAKVRDARGKFWKSRCSLMTFPAF